MPSRPLTVIRAITATTAVLMLSAACGSTSKKEGTQPDIGDYPAVTAEDQIKLPFDAYELTGEQDQQLLQANHMLVVTCGAKYGVQVTMPVGQNPTVGELNGRRYGIVDREYAKGHGYRPRPSAAEADDRSAWNPSAAELIVISGPSMAEPGQAIPHDQDGNPVPKGGCAGSAWKELGGDPPSTAQEAGADTYDRAQNDSRVQEAWDAWASCMNDKGYDYKSPWDPNNANWPEKVGEKEITTALDDIDCREETNLVGIWMAVESAYQEQEIQDNPEADAALRQWHDDQVRRVSDILNRQ